MPDSQHDANDYTVGWAPADHNNYVLGQIRGHNVVIACLPAGVYGTTSAATVAKDMLRTFKSIRFGLMVGIGGGAPSPSHDIRLGDIVVSQPSGTTGGVVQYDRGKDGREGHFERTGSLNAPPQLLLTALGRLQANHLLGRNRIPDFLTEFLAQGPKMKKTFGFQGESNDCLFQAEYEHASGEARCEQCDVAQAVQRDARDDTDPVVHYGTIASGNHVIKNARTRDQLSKELGVICFEMEAAGLMQDFPCVVIRGICDYSDTHKNKAWQGYAATVAAAFAKELLQQIQPSKVEAERRIVESLGNNKKAVDGDIGSFVAAQLVDRRDFREKGLSRELSERIQSQVGNGADGILAQCRHEAAIESALGSLPRNLDETYKRMLENIPKELKSDALRLLQFLLHLEQPLRLADAVEVIATQTEGESTGFDIKRRLFREADVLDYCPSLVVIVHAGHDELHLSHFSVKEYLLTNDLLQLPTASGSITKTCLTYLTDIGGRPDEVQQKFCMARFAAKIWVRFAASAEAEAEILQQILVENGEDIDAQGGEYGNALQAALSRGHVKIVKLLLEKGADADAKGGWRINALETASFGGCIEVVKLLLGTGVDAHAQSGYYGNALQAASLGGCIEVVKLLLEKGVDAHAQGGYYGNALQAASLGGYIEVVKLLLEKGADADAQGGQYGNALQAATSRGHVKVVKLLLEKGVDAHAQGGYYGNALQAALFGGYIEVVKLLLEKGVDADA
ncbi:hypothetical protein ACHAQA_004641 [Verticillium albo-atrum]